MFNNNKICISAVRSKKCLPTYYIYVRGSFTATITNYLLSISLYVNDTTIFIFLIYK